MEHGRKIQKSYLTLAESKNKRKCNFNVGSFLFILVGFLVRCLSLGTFICFDVARLRIQLQYTFRH